MNELITLLISLASLTIAIIALIITKKIYILSSKDYLPSITFEVEDETFEIINSTNDIYKIHKVNLIKFDTYGFEAYKTGKICKVSFVTKPKANSFYDKEQSQKKIKCTFDAVGPCAYLCPYDDRTVNELYEKILNECTEDSKIGYALPSIRSTCYTIEICYKNKFLETKSVIYNYEHFHGHGFEKFKIDDKELNLKLSNANIPKLKTGNLLWNYLLTEKWKLF